MKDNKKNNKINDEKLNEVVQKAGTAFRIIRICLSIVGAVIGSILLAALIYAAVVLIRGISQYIV